MIDITPPLMLLPAFALLLGCTDVTPDDVAPVRANAVIAASAQSVETGIAANAPHAVDRERDGLFYVNATINGQRLRMLVDTGASVMVLTAADARLVGAAPETINYDRSVETVGGSAAMAWTTLSRVELAGRDIRNVRAAVVREGLGVSLLGQNMLAQFHSVTISAGQLSLR